MIGTACRFRAFLDEHLRHCPCFFLCGAARRRAGAHAVRPALCGAAAGGGDQHPRVHAGVHLRGAVPAARRDDRVERGADLRRGRSGVSGGADIAHLRGQPPARPGDHRRAGQPLAAVRGRPRRHPARRAAAGAATRGAVGDRGRRCDHHRHAAAGRAQLASLDAAAAAGSRVAARADAADDQARARDLAEPDRGGTDGLHRLGPGGAHLRADQDRTLYRRSAACADGCGSSRSG